MTPTQPPASPPAQPDVESNPFEVPEIMQLVRQLMTGDSDLLPMQIYYTIEARITALTKPPAAVPVGEPRPRFWEDLKRIMDVVTDPPRRHAFDVGAAHFRLRQDLAAQGFAIVPAAAPVGADEVVVRREDLRDIVSYLESKLWDPNAQFLSGFVDRVERLIAALVAAHPDAPAPGTSEGRREG